MVIRPVLNYGSTVWWPRFRYNVSRTELSQLHRLACLAILGAMKMNSTFVMEVLHGLPPLHVMTEAEAWAGIYTLMCTKQWRPKSTNFGHTKQSRDMKHKTMLQMGSYRLLPRFSHSQLSSLTCVNCRTGSTQATKKGLV